jgi:hypothetical protein
MLISVHLPKTAGTSLLKSLQSHYGDALLTVYGDMPINTPPFERNKAALLASIHNAEAAKFSGTECIHGHFLPLKYLLLSLKQDLKFITWLRDPVERVLSHFYYWKRYYDPATAPRLHRKMVEEDWSAERFCLSAELQNLYGQFFWGFPLEYFDFIGITEYYSEDLSYFSRKYLGTALEVHIENVGDKEGGKYSIEKSFRTEIEKFHSYDIGLYKTALEMRQKRLSISKDNDSAND